MTGIATTVDGLEARGLGPSPTYTAQVQNRSQTLDAFLAEVERRAFRMAEIATRDRDEALDIVQDSMMQLARRYADKPAQDWPPLFYRILENRIRDWQRRQAIRRRLFFWRDSDLEPDGDGREALIERLADETRPDQVEQLQQRESMQVLESALRALPARQREAFELRIWQGLSVEQTAQAMGCTGGSVKTHLSRALQALRNRLDGVWP